MKYKYYKIEWLTGHISYYRDCGWKSQCYSSEKSMWTPSVYKTEKTLVSICGDRFIKMTEDEFFNEIMLGELNR